MTPEPPTIQVTGRDLSVLHYGPRPLEMVTMYVQDLQQLMRASDKERDSMGFLTTFSGMTLGVGSSLVATPTSRPYLLVFFGLLTIGLFLASCVFAVHWWRARSARIEAVSLVRSQLPAPTAVHYVARMDA